MELKIFSKQSIHLKNPTLPFASPLRTWGSRRMNKQAKYGRFEAQQHLEAEIRAKQQTLEELRLARTRCDELERELMDQRRKNKQQREEMDRVADENVALRLS
jgi:hypothetical protein